MQGGAEIRADPQGSCGLGSRGESAPPTHSWAICHQFCKLGTYETSKWTVGAPQLGQVWPWRLGHVLMKAGWGLICLCDSLGGPTYTTAVVLVPDFSGFALVAL